MCTQPSSSFLIQNGLPFLIANDFFCVEVLREKDGVPDLRRAARYRYTSVTVPEVNNGSQFKNVRELEDAMTAAIIRNLKIAQVDHINH